MAFFAKHVDRRSRAAMTNVLRGHFRDNTMNSWNAVASYAHCAKVHRLGMPAELDEAAWETVCAGIDLHSEFVMDIIDDFGLEVGHRYTIGWNGRSDGYLVLYKSALESTGYRSYCTICGQHNYQYCPPTYPDGSVEAQLMAHHGVDRIRCLIPQTLLKETREKLNPRVDDAVLSAAIGRLKRELVDCSSGDRCGVCRGQRQNYAETPKRVVVYPGRGIDEDDGFEDWEMDRLRDRVDLVMRFDRTVDRIRDEFIERVRLNAVVEETIYVPRTLHKLSPRNAAIG